MLALKFAWEAQKDFDAVIFQTCGQRPLDAITAELADRLPIDVKTSPPEEQRAAAKAWLRERQSLLVLDDVWSAEMRQLEPGPACSVLYTSRLKSLPWTLFRAPSNRWKALRSRKRRRYFTLISIRISARPKSRAIARRCWVSPRRVEMLPIAVAVGASLLREKTASPLDEGALDLRMGELTDGVKDVPGLFQKAIASQPEREQKLLAACAVCVQAGFWLPLARDIAELSDRRREESGRAPGELLAAAGD